jgi:hypothetical protein
VSKVVETERLRDLAGSNCVGSERGDTKKQLLSWLRDELFGVSLEDWRISAPRGAELLGGMESRDEMPEGGKLLKGSWCVSTGWRKPPSRRRPT